MTEPVPGTCSHPAESIVDEDGERLCTVCFSIVEDEVPAATLDCPHPPAEQRLITKDGASVQLCGVCWQERPVATIGRGDPSGATVAPGGPAATGAPRPELEPLPAVAGAADPATGEGWLSFIDPAHFTPEQCERELLVITGRLNAGERFGTVKAREFADAQLAYDLAYARALVGSVARSADQRKAEAMLRCEDEYRDLKVAEVVDKTTRSQLHTLRSQMSAVQSVLRSSSAAAHGR